MNEWVYENALFLRYSCKRTGMFFFSLCKTICTWRPLKLWVTLRFRQQRQMFLLGRCQPLLWKPSLIGNCVQQTVLGLLHVLSKLQCKRCYETLPHDFLWAVGVAVERECKGRASRLPTAPLLLLEMEWGPRPALRMSLWGGGEVRTQPGVLGASLTDQKHRPWPALVAQGREWRSEGERKDQNNPLFFSSDRPRTRSSLLGTYSHLLIFYM